MPLLHANEKTPEMVIKESLGIKLGTAWKDFVLIRPDAVLVTLDGRYAKADSEKPERRLMHSGFSYFFDRGVLSGLSYFPLKPEDLAAVLKSTRESLGPELKSGPHPRNPQRTQYVWVIDDRIVMVEEGQDGQSGKIQVATKGFAAAHELYLTPISVNEIEQRLEKVRFKNLNLSGGFDDLDLIVYHIRQTCIKADPWFEQIGFVNLVPSEKKAAKAATASGIGPNLTDIPAPDFIKAIAQVCRVRTEVAGGTIFFLPVDETMEPMFEKVFQDLSVGFFPDAEIQGSDEWIDVRNVLEKKGLNLWKGSAASFNPKKSILRIRATQSQVDFVDRLIQQEE